MNHRRLHDAQRVLARATAAAHDPTPLNLAVAMQGALIALILLQEVDEDGSILAMVEDSVGDERARRRHHRR